MVIRSLGRGGAEQHLLHVLPRLNAERFSVTLTPLYPEGTLLEAFEKSSVGLRCLSRASLFSRLTEFGGYVRHERPIVHCFLPEAYLLCGTVARIYGAPAVLMSRRSRNHYQLKHPIAAQFERILHSRMDFLIGNSRAVVNDLVSEGAVPDKVRLIYNGIDVDRFSTGLARLDTRMKVRSILGMPQSATIIICIANLFPYKGHRDLFNAVALLGEAFVRDLHLLIIGRDAGALNSLRGLVMELGIADRVHFLGERNDVPDLLAASDIAVLPSHEEGFSNAVLEGMAAELPMVVTDVGGNAEAIVDGVSGVVVPPHRPDAIATGLARLLGDEGLRSSLGFAARTRVASLFSLAACVEQYENLYEEVWKRCNLRASR